LGLGTFEPKPNKSAKEINCWLRAQVILDLDLQGT
jgi:hypothetical protein